MAKSYEYTNTDAASIGRMICAGCGKKITAGDYRYRDARDRYVLHHRACSSQDPKWALKDAAAVKAAKKRLNQTKAPILVSECGECPLHHRDSYYGSSCSHPFGPALNYFHGDFPEGCPLGLGPVRLSREVAA